MIGALALGVFLVPRGLEENHGAVAAVPGFQDLDRRVESLLASHEPGAGWGGKKLQVDLARLFF